jgi:hypothetical protein
MKFASVRTFALSLPEVTEEPHHDLGSFRVRGKIFVTFASDLKEIRVFIPDEQREPALAVYPSFTDKLLWGGKVVGVKVTLAKADSHAVKSMIRSAWQHKAPKALQKIIP